MQIPTSRLISPGLALKRPLLQRAGSLGRKNWIRALFLALAGLVVHLPSLPGELIWDDLFLARDNPFIKSPLLIFENFRHHLFLDSFSAHYRPVQNLSYTVDYFFWNTDMYGFHLGSILWHVASGILLFLLLQRLLPSLIGSLCRSDEETASTQPPDRPSLVAFFLALIWIVHPVHSAAVDYISGRADSVAFFFACGGWLLFSTAGNRKRRASRIVSYLFAGSSLLLALCSRESAFLWLTVFLLHLFFFDKRFSRSAKLLTLVACLVVVGGYIGLRQLPGPRETNNPTYNWAAPVRAVLMLRALGDYGRLMIFPGNLHMERTVVNTDANRSNEEWRSAIGSEYLTLAGLLVLAGLIAASIWKAPGKALRRFGAAWFLLAYLPTSNIVDLNATVAEHWLYLPSVGFILLAAGCLIALPRSALKFATVTACMGIVALGARSYVRSSDWLNGKTFYTRTLEAGGGSVRVLVNLGQVYAAEGEYHRAEILFRRALAACPDYLIARNNLADVLFRQGKRDEADATFQKANAAASEARKEYPRTWVAALNLAKMRLEANDTPGALELLAKARQDYPGVWRLISLESELLRKTRGPDAALVLVADFVRDNWWHLDGAVALGKLYAEKGEVTKAEAAFQLASRLDVHDVSGLNQIALLRVNQHRFEEACAIQRRAIARQPDEPRQYLILSDILEKMGRGDEAQVALAQVKHLQSLVKASSAASGDMLAN